MRLTSPLPALKVRFRRLGFQPVQANGFFFNSELSLSTTCCEGESPFLHLFGSKFSRAVRPLLSPTSCKFALFSEFRRDLRRSAECCFSQNLVCIFFWGGGLTLSHGDRVDPGPFSFFPPYSTNRVREYPAFLDSPRCGYSSANEKTRQDFYNCLLQICF